MRRILILGATSAIAQETAKLLAADGDRLFLVARNPDRLKAVHDDLAVRGADGVASLVADLNDFDRHGEILERASSSMGGLDTVLVAYGVLGDQEACQRDYRAAEEVLRTNFLGCVSLLTLVANEFESRGSGTIIGICSVAGDRGRQSNYVYGASKGAFSLFLAGLRNRLFPAGVTVITVKPGFVDTPMTARLAKGPLFAAPETIARGIRKAMLRRKNVVYLPWFWRPIMLVVRHIPERVFKRLKL